MAMAQDKMQFKVVEISISKFDSAISQQIMLLKNHISNIEKFSALSHYDKVRKEEINANRIIKQMENLIKEIDVLKTQVDSDNLPKFLSLTRKSKDEVFTITQQFTALNRKTNRQIETENKQTENDPIDNALPLLQIQSDVNRMQLEIEEDRLKRCEALQQDVEDLNEIFHKVSGLVHEQGELVEAISENVEETSVNVHEGERQLLRALKYKKTMYPLCGALLGVCVGGPIGLLAGLKIGVGVAVGGGLAGFTSGKIIKNSHDNQTSDEVDSKEPNEEAVEAK